MTRSGGVTVTLFLLWSFPVLYLCCSSTKSNAKIKEEPKNVFCLFNREERNMPAVTPLWRAELMGSGTSHSVALVALRCCLNLNSQVCQTS